MKNKRLIQTRKLKGLTQSQLAQRLGFKGKQSVANWENGHSTPTLTTAMKIADILDVNVEFLFGHVVQETHTKSGNII